MAFTDEQNEQIRNDLIREAQRCGITIGMRKTSVEQLTEAGVLVERTGQRRNRVWQHGGIVGVLDDYARRLIRT